MEQTAYWNAIELREQILDLQKEKKSLEISFNDKNNNYKLIINVADGRGFNITPYFDIEDLIQKTLVGMQEKIDELEEEFKKL